MWRDRALKVVLVIVGLSSIAEIYYVIKDLRHLYVPDPGDTMMYSLDITFGIFLLIPRPICTFRQSVHGKSRSSSPAAR